MAAAIARLEDWGEAKPGSAPGAVPYDMVSGVDAGTRRDDVPPRATAVSDEESTDAVTASIFVGWLSRLPRLVLADELAGTGIGVPGGEDATKALLHLLEDVGRTDDGFRVHTLGDGGESTLWDDLDTLAVETRDEILLAGLAEGLRFLAGAFETDDPRAWLWGDIHPARFQHFYGQGGLPLFDLFPFPAPGGRFTVNPADFSLNADRFDFAAGPSMRLVVVLDPAGIRAVNVLPGGNNGNPGGTDYENFNRLAPEIDYGQHIPAWLNGETLELRVGREDVAAHAARRMRFAPGGA
jgi:penicillin amidase